MAHMVWVYIITRGYPIGLSLDHFKNEDIRWLWQDEEFILCHSQTQSLSQFQNITWREYSECTTVCSYSDLSFCEGYKISLKMLFFYPLSVSSKI